MKRIAWVLLALGLVASGCILTSGQIQVSFNLPDVKGSTTSGIVGQTINLNDESEYEKNKDKLKGLSDFAVLGKFVNQDTTNPVDIEVWMTTDTTSYTTETALKASSTALKLWGPFTVAANGTRIINWNDSAKLFSTAGKAALLNEAKGDGMFTLYAVGKAGTYDFKVDNGVLVLVIDAGI